jgi:hypothetical protein
VTLRFAPDPGGPRLRLLGKEAARQRDDTDIRRLTDRIDTFRQAVASPGGRCAQA